MSYIITIECDGYPLHSIVVDASDTGLLFTQQLFNYSFAKEQRLRNDFEDLAEQTERQAPDGSNLSDFGE